MAIENYLVERTNSYFMFGNCWLSHEDKPYTRLTNRTRLTGIRYQMRKQATCAAALVCFLRCKLYVVGRAYGDTITRSKTGLD